MWMPMPVQQSSTNMRHLLVLGGRIVGFVLIFLGTIIEVLASSVPGGCFTQAGSCTSNFLAQVANGIIVGKALWVVGLFCLGGASGMRLAMPGGNASTPKGDEVPWAMHRRRLNALVLLVSILLMFVILITVNAAPPWFTAIP
jgi:hypothetical protein